MVMNPEFLGHLVDRHSAPLILYARQWCSGAEDVVQDAFLKLVVQRPPPVRVLPWLYRVVRNAAISAGRAERRRRRHETAAASRTAAWFAAVEATALDVAAATQALQALPMEQREIIVAHLWGGLTFEQVAEVIGCSSSTAHRGYIAGLTALRERLRVPCP